MITPMIQVLFILSSFDTALAFSGQPLSKKGSPIWLEHADNRLDVRLSIQAKRVLIGDLLAQLSQSSAVAIHVNGIRNGASDFEVAVSLTDQSLICVMEGIRSLFSHRGAEWTWRQTSTTGSKYEYVLGRTAAARNLTNALRDQVQAAFEQEVEDRIAAVTSPSEEADALVARRPDLADTLKQDSLRGGIAFLKDHLSSAELRRVLRREMKASVDVSRLNTASRSWAQAILDRSLPEAQRIPINVAREVSVYTFRNPVAPTPSLFIGIGPLGASGYAGGIPLERKVGDQIMLGWRRKGEEVGGPIADRAIVSKLKEPEVPSRRLTRDEIRALGRSTNSISIHDVWMELAKGADVDVIAEYGDRPLGGGTPYPNGKTVREFCKLLEDPIIGIGYMSKLTGSILLFRDRAFFWNSPEESLVPWEDIRRWRMDLEKRGGLISGSTLMELLRLNAEQTRRIQDEFPEAQHSQAERSVLKLWAKLPELQRRQAERKGLSLASISRHLLAEFFGSDPSVPLNLKGWTLHVTRPQPMELSTNRLAAVRIEGTITRPDAHPLFTGIISRQRRAEEMKSRVKIRVESPVSP